MVTLTVPDSDITLKLEIFVVPSSEMVDFWEQKCPNVDVGVSPVYKKITPPSSGVIVIMCAALICAAEKPKSEMDTAEVTASDFATTP